MGKRKQKSNTKVGQFNIYATWCIQQYARMSPRTSPALAKGGRTEGAGDEAGAKISWVCERCRNTSSPSERTLHYYHLSLITTRVAPTIHDGHDANAMDGYHDSAGIECSSLRRTHSLETAQYPSPRAARCSIYLLRYTNCIYTILYYIYTISSLRLMCLLFYYFPRHALTTLSHTHTHTDRERETDRHIPPGCVGFPASIPPFHPFHACARPSNFFF